MISYSAEELYIINQELYEHIGDALTQAAPLLSPEIMESLKLFGLAEHSTFFRMQDENGQYYFIETRIMHAKVGGKIASAIGRINLYDDRDEYERARVQMAADHGNVKHFGGKPI